MTNPSTEAESQPEPESAGRGISDDQLPEDLQPDENPLAEGLDDGETAGDLLEEGRPAEQSEAEQSESESGGG